jgi:spermidine/putrescine transport system substrate-binding protein
MKINRMFLLPAALLVLSLVLAACSSPPASSDTNGEAAVEPATEIVLYNWTDYMEPGILSQFEQETGIRVIEDYFSSNEEMIAKLQGGATGYSLVIPSDYAVAILKEQGLITPLDHSQISNLANLNERFKTNDLDPDNKYCVPYQWGTTGIGYDASAIDAPTSWAAIFDAVPGDPQYGRMTMVDDARETFSAALLYLGYDVNTTDEAQLQEARDLLIQAKAGLSGYDSDTFEDLVASGENVLAHGWNGEFLMAKEENENVTYLIPDEGGVIYMEEICIPTNASPEEKLAAEMFINYLLRGDVGAQLSEYIYYGSPNEAAQEFLSEDYKTNTIINPPQEVLDRLHFLKPLGEFDTVYTRLWDEVKAAP